MQKSWSEINALYQIYPRSYQDTNGDGVGDIRGIIDRLDYIGSVADAIWLSPVYQSPQKDYGYDISSFVDIHPEYGTLEDMAELISEAHRRGIKIIMDFVPNHTSDQHEWFQASRSSRENPKRNWYIWRDPKAGAEPNNWVSLSGGKSWQYDETTGQYYLHSWLPCQPDLNWENPEVRHALGEAMRFWFERGIDGFRVDAVWVMSKNENFDDDPLLPGGDITSYGGYAHTSCRNGDRLNDYLKAMADIAAEYHDRLLVLEYYPSPEFGDANEQLYDLHAIAPEVCTTFFFDAMNWSFDAKTMGQGFNNYLQKLPAGARPVFCFGNHDQTRIATRFGGDQQARLVAVLQLTLPGLPSVYYGEELGMSDGYIPEGEGRDGFGGTMGGRDPERTPMQWSGGDCAGFSTVKPWLPIDPKNMSKNVADEERDSTSFLNLYRALLDLRRQLPVFRHGQFSLLGYDNNILAYDMYDDSGRYRVLLNFANYEQTVLVEGEVVCSSATVSSNLTSRQGQTRLAPLEAVVIKQ